MGNLTVEEINLLCVFDGKDRGVMIADIKRVQPLLKDSEMEELTEQVLNKLENMTDSDNIEVVRGRVLIARRK